MSLAAGALLIREGPDGPAEARPLAPGEEFVVGRDAGCDLVVADRHLSKRHFRFFWRDTQLMVEDLDSAHGIHVNGKPCKTASLRPGDRVAARELTLRVDPAGGGGAGDPAALEAVLASLDAVLARVADSDSDQLTDSLAPVVEEVMRLFDAQRGVVLVRRSGGGGAGFQRLHERVEAGHAGAALPVSKTLLERVLAAGEAALLTTAETAELAADVASVAGELRSIIAAPLQVERQKAVLYLDSVVSHRRFDEGQRRLLGGVTRLLEGVLARDAARRRRLRKENERDQARRQAEAGAEILGRSPAITRVLADIGKAAGVPVPVLIEGETGTGKELTARAVHRASDRAAGPFIAINAAALPRELVEGELFGTEKGAYTGATEARAGVFEMAEGGTLFLDEVGELPLEVQSKLLRVLQERRVRRLGSGLERPVDFRLVAATNVDLEAAAAAGEFRADLFYRLGVYRIRLPPLRDRGEDVVALADHFLAAAAREFRRPVLGFDDAAAALLRGFGWPGNIRQLKNFVEQAVLREGGDWVKAATVRGVLGGGAEAPLVAEGGVAAPAVPAGAIVLTDPPEGFADARRDFERAFLRRVLADEKGNIKRVSERIGLARKNLYAKCDDLGIDYKGFR